MRQEAARQEAARVEAARAKAEQEERREAARRAIGRQLDAEADRREAAAAARRDSKLLPYSLSTARRARLWGRTNPNAELVWYAEAWARKIEFNTPVDTVRRLRQQIRINPMVTVAIRSDGSVESVTFVVSSGVPEVDEAIRTIVQDLHFQGFPPGLASEYDVVEIRRTWYFDDAIRLY
ncbi:MAG: TonB family protein [Burkholderiaceae bacterium]